MITEKRREQKQADYQRNKDKRKATMRKWRENNLERKKEMDKIWYENNKEHKKEYDKKYYTENKEYILERNKKYRKTPAGKIAMSKDVQKRLGTAQVRARHKVSNAIRDGKLKRQPCSICGKKAESHHPDYNDKLNIIWLCRKHHLEIHK